ncbi:GNAT family N-acetyltransferase [Peribacillus butanolivorans]
MRKQGYVEELSNSSEFNEDYYEEYWGSVSNFSENGFGYCILHKGKVVSECTSILLHYNTQKLILQLTRIIGDKD